MFIAHNNAQLYAVSFGNSQRAFLGIGGWAGSWELWTNPFCTLSQSWRAIAYDHRGTGVTIAPVETITVETMVDDLFAVLDHFQIETCVLGAESAGVAIALLAALRHPERITGLTLVDGMYYRQPAEKDMFLLGLQHAYPATMAQFVNQCLTEQDGEAVNHWGNQILNRVTQEAAIQLYTCVAHIDLRAELAKISQPTLIIHGEQDKILSPESSRWMATQIPASKLVMIPQAGHVPTITHPEVIAEAINTYFADI